MLLAVPLYSFTNQISLNSKISGWELCGGRSWSLFVSRENEERGQSVRPLHPTLASIYSFLFCVEKHKKISRSMFILLLRPDLFQSSWSQDLWDSPPLFSHHHPPYLSSSSSPFSNHCIAALAPRILIPHTKISAHIFSRISWIIKTSKKSVWPVAREKMLVPLNIVCRLLSRLCLNNIIQTKKKRG